MGTKVDFLYLSEPDMVKAGVKDMKQSVEVMERLLVTLNKGDYVMGGKNHNSHRNSSHILYQLFLNISSIF